MMLAEHPRFHLCAACVAARGLERGDAGFQRVIRAVSITGKCDDCGVNDAELEAWQRVNVPPPPPTQPMVPDERAVLKGKDR